MNSSAQENAKLCLKRGDRHPYDDPNRYNDDGIPPVPAHDWAHRAARGILEDLGDRRGIKHELEMIDDDVRIELTESLAEIIRQAKD
jgi:hypothetical protein